MQLNAKYFSKLLSIISLLFIYFLYEYNHMAFSSESNITEDFDTQNSGCIYQNFIKRKSLTIVKNGTSDSLSGKVSYVGNEKGSSGGIFVCPLSLESKKYTLEFDVKFDKDFEFVKGGKLHGLGPQKIMSGGNGIAPDGWSARVIFLANGQVGIYYYNQDQKGRFGDVVTAANFIFSRDTYYRIRMDLDLNSVPSLSDGSVRLYIDGVQLINKSNILFYSANSNKALISNFLFSTFHGGSTDAWAPKNSDGTFKTVDAFFDNFLLTPR